MKNSSIQVCMGDGTKVVTYVGRCLGLLTQEQFNAVIQREEVFRKLYTVPTKKLREIGKRDIVENFRLAFALKKKGGEEIHRKKILFTGPLEFISEVKSNGDSIFINSKNKEFLIVEEIPDE